MYMYAECCLAIQLKDKNSIYYSRVIATRVHSGLYGHWATR